MDVSEMPRRETPERGDGADASVGRVGGRSPSTLSTGGGAPAAGPLAPGQRAISIKSRFGSCHRGAAPAQQRQALVTDPRRYLRVTRNPAPHGAIRDAEIAGQGTLPAPSIQRLADHAESGGGHLLPVMT